MGDKNTTTETTEVATPTITESMLDYAVADVKLSKVCGVSADAEGKARGEGKQVTVNVDFSGVSLRAVFNKAVSSTVITWQNGQGRKNYTKLGKAVNVRFAAPAERDPIQASIAAFKTMSKEQRAAYKAQLDALGKE